MGAWIEILKSSNTLTSLPSSLPSWERGLKFMILDFLRYRCGSLPSWERGLKWQSTTKKDRKPKVAPFVGAWIEMTQIAIFIVPAGVAPFVGAWIEMADADHNRGATASLPSWERGLK